MSLLIVSKGGVQDIGEAIVRALIGAADYRGRPFVLSTIPPEILERAALAAIVTVTGQPVWQFGTAPMEVEPDEKLPFLRKIYPKI